MKVKELIEQLRKLDEELLVMDAMYWEHDDSYTVEEIDTVLEVGRIYPKVRDVYKVSRLPLRYVVVTSSPIQEAMKYG